MVVFYKAYKLLVTKFNIILLFISSVNNINYDYIASIHLIYGYFRLS